MTAEVARDTLKAGDTLDGPALVTEDETTIVVPSSRTLLVHADATLDLRAKPSRNTETTHG